MEKDCGAQINLLSRMLKRRLNVTLQGLGITAIQSRVMFYIMDHCLEGPVFQRDVEQAFSLSRSTATGILQQLEEKGLLRRESPAAAGERAQRRAAEKPGAHPAGSRA